LLSESLFTVEIYPLNDLERPSLLKIGEKNIYIADGYQVKVFSKATKKMIYTLGKQGSGPGEFNNRPDSVQILKDGILCSSPYKLIYFSYAGAYLKEVKTKKAIRHLKKLTNDSYIGLQLKAGKTSITDLTLNLYDNTFNVTKVLKTTLYESKKATMDLFIRFTYAPYHIDTLKGKIIFADIKENFKMNISDKAGKLLKQIRRDIVPLEFKEEDKAKVFQFWESQNRLKKFINLFKLSVSFPRYYPPICTWKVADNKIYMVTFNKQEKQNQCLVYDLEGNFIKESFLPLKSESEILYIWYPFDISKNQFYQVIDNYEEETWELVITNIT
jgi:hypothetical protein